MSELLSDFVLARLLGQVAQEVPQVAGVYSGHQGQIATYGPGGRVPGVRVWREAGRVLVEIHLIITYAPALNLLTLAETVRSRLATELAQLAAGHAGTIDVVVADLTATTTATRSRV